MSDSANGAIALTLAGPRPVRGRLRLPGCKGISHRALLFAAMAEGDSHLRGLASGADVRSTQRALEALGVSVHDEPDHGATIKGLGVDAFEEPEHDLDCGNSATTMRMLAGLLAGRPFRSVLTGDASLSERPMGRVVEPLQAMGAWIEGRNDATLAPLILHGETTGGALHGTAADLAVASGQVKTALILAGLQADDTTTVSEPAPSRDHTERMLEALGAPVERTGPSSVRVTRGAPTPFDLDVPGDPSSAAFFVVAATITPGSELVLQDVLLNPGRLEFVDVLRRMGASIEVRVLEERLGEPVGEILIRAAPLHGTTVECHEPMIDEVPALAVAAAFADGITEFTNAAEMRVKETDRIATLAAELVRLGVGVEARADGLVVRGASTRTASAYRATSGRATSSGADIAFDSHGDHRIALAAAIAANALDGESRITGWDAADVSYPGFADDLARLTGAGS